MSLRTGQLHVGRGKTVGAVTLFPVWGERTGIRPRTYITVSDSVSYAELDSGPTISLLHATNACATSVLVLDGQLFEGGWQDRMATRSHLLAAGGEQTIDVACVERDRWGGQASHRTRYRRSPASVRAGADVGGQNEIWRRIDRRATRSQTGSLLGAMDAADEQAALLIRHTRPLAGQTGLMVGIGGVPVTLEVFDSPLTLREQLGHIVKAAALDALGAPALPTSDRSARHAARLVERTPLDMEPRVGQPARLGRGSSSGFDVMELSQQLTSLHLRAINHRHPSLAAV
ncbi:hypothetical protein FXB39_10425 [Nocardioides sp. BGMRC 2183]|nr:hypothetical protein FXB39_10425 [Nocardioides sp. BGMRC 2183]